MEREIVRLVNEKFPSCKVSLSGFSHAAIDRWYATGPFQESADKWETQVIKRMKALSVKMRLASASSHRGPEPSIGVEAELLDEEKRQILTTLGKGYSRDNE